MQNKINLVIFSLIVFIGVNQILIWGLQKEAQNNKQIIQSQSELLYKLSREITLIKKSTQLENMFKGIKVRKLGNEKRELIVN